MTEEEWSEFFKFGETDKHKYIIKSGRYVKEGNKVTAEIVLEEKKEKTK